jgi:hypothetical protein
MFKASSLMIISKIDLLPYVDFDVNACIAFARRINPDIEVLQLSATSGEGLQQWYAWLMAKHVESSQVTSSESTLLHPPGKIGPHLALSPSDIG